MRSVITEINWSSNFSEEQICPNKSMAKIPILKLFLECQFWNGKRDTVFSRNLYYCSRKNKENDKETNWGHKTGLSNVSQYWKYEKALTISERRDQIRRVFSSTNSALYKMVTCLEIKLLFVISRLAVLLSPTPRNWLVMHAACSWINHAVRLLQHLWNR